MKIKLIAVDMDGTFLDDNKCYDKERFMAQYAALRHKGVKFVVASGNQYYQLISFFPEIRHDIAFVAENGALVYDRDERLWHGELPHDSYLKVLDALAAFDGVNFVACGLKSAYAREGAPEAFMAIMAKHYHRLQSVADLRKVDDVIFKFALNLPDAEIPALVNQLNHSLDGIVRPVTSGFGFVDLIIPGAHKASGLQRLLDRWAISPQECVAVGDSSNDVEMLRLVGYPFAMENAVSEVKAVARYETTSNNQAGVLRIIDRVLNGESPFC
ncbi:MULTISPECIES: Cof-type HAD-IIB family hydrolase [Tenebrionibacter/Tenebrionicola group]|jgi:sugar-phosphatase|uniref:HAD family hydrolase n=2 Tax=Tenebrionibacter/Tenebrionicola group TaxID=2969848 RepID=A0A8K0VA35_9ENTR|nr:MULTISPECIES: Cof-type HAD-IIB family hydrolase [Tenebrionibacter/Tenebrionicola group]MBK4716980.1 HAD family hydrolase [Tenebrionibacter intestinalis]MBV4411250.1 HAD family hydrolase [Tenebrionicola larvae]MBV5097518.1 HAD family hydrolase [Tenebrionicola larvae]